MLHEGDIPHGRWLFPFPRRVDVPFSPPALLPTPELESVATGEGMVADEERAEFGQGIAGERLSGKRDRSREAACLAPGVVDISVDLVDGSNAERLVASAAILCSATSSNSADRATAPA